MFASNHAWLIYIRVVQARVAARELPGQTVGGDVLERSLYILTGPRCRVRRL